MFHEQHPSHSEEVLLGIRCGTVDGREHEHQLRINPESGLRELGTGILRASLNVADLEKRS